MDMACDREGAVLNEVEALVRLSCRRVALAAESMINSDPALINRSPNQPVDDVPQAHALAQHHIAEEIQDVAASEAVESVSAL
jgi:hypothetical protein